MQTFLPYPSFIESAQCLDYKRLGKQRVEVLQLIRGGWPNHPASKMWHGHFYQLGKYGEAICLEWISYGYKDTCLDKIEAEQLKFSDTGLPKWIGNEAFHLAHKSNLIRKNREFYGPMFPGVPDNLPYVWPV